MHFGEIQLLRLNALGFPGWKHFTCLRPTSDASAANLHWWDHCMGIDSHVLDIPTPEQKKHYSDVIMGAMASLITSLASVYSTFHPGVDQRKHQSSAPLAFVRGIHRWSVNSPHKWPVTRKIFPFDDVIMLSAIVNDVLKCIALCEIYAPRIPPPPPPLVAICMEVVYQSQLSLVQLIIHQHRTDEMQLPGPND